MINYFRATKENPYHISIGGLVFNKEGNILVHHFKNKKLGDIILDDLYLLLRETIEPNESIEQTLHRGLMEEFGLKGEIIRYLGSIKGKLPLGDVWAEKTTLYFLVRYSEHDELNRQQGTSEAESDLEWVNPHLLICYMEKQRFLDGSMDESEIVKRFLE